MIYLFSQIAISLVLAAIFGGAVGWLMHRARASRHIDQLQDIVDRQQQQVSEAQTEVSILTADFDDLKQVSESKISKLSRENKEIPALNQNLEKSQLLVRQLMEKHKAEIDESNEENERLLVKSRQVDALEKEITKLQAELDIERRKSARADSSNNVSALPSTHQTSENSTNNRAAPSPTNQASTDQNPASGSNNNVTINANEVSQTTANAPNSRRPSLSENLGANSSANSVGSDDFTSLDQNTDSNDDTLPNTAQTQSELAELRDQLAEDIPTTDSGRASSSNFVEVSPKISGPHKLTETEVDDTDLEQMFDTVDQHDDLKQIFGIGPVTEKTLNKLGITAYSQLAELKQHDIEKIANALQIFPGRIERDNWVGGARAQLEEVLEDL